MEAEAEFIASDTVNLSKKEDAKVPQCLPEKEEPLNDKNISIDHFVPWSYVAHDELWNLTPTTRSINSSKSNNLPDWNRYFPILCKVERKGAGARWFEE